MLEPPAVPAEVYTEEYYRRACGPHEEWKEGTSLAGYYIGTVRAVGIQNGDRLLDLGAGRGELLAAAVKAGASEATGVEYAPTAIDLANTTLMAQGVEHQARILQADARATGLPDESFDVVTVLDVVEHMTPEEVDATLREALRVLQPGGKVAIHTLPNRLVYDVTYRLQRLAVPTRVRNWPANPRSGYEHAMHVNEYTLRKLRRHMKKAGLTNLDVRRGRWVIDHMVPGRSKRLYHMLARRKLTQPFGVADLWGFGYKPND